MARRDDVPLPDFSNVARGVRPPIDTRTRILGAALELFAERGFAGATTAEIARLAGVAEKTLFSHFKTKDALFDQTLTPATIDLLIPEVLTPLDDSPRESADHLDQFLHHLMSDRLRILLRHPSKFKLIVQELLLRPERARQLVLARKDPITPRLEEVLKRLRGRGELRHLATSLVLRMYAYVLLGYAVERLVFSPDSPWNDDGEIESMVDILVEGLKPRRKVAAARKTARPARRKARGSDDPV